MTNQSPRTALRRVLSVFLVLAAVGCASTDERLRPGAQSPATVTSSVNLSGYPPEFRRGFTDGCAAARANDPSSRPKGDGAYSVGWNDGFDYCKSRKQN
jgi:hypothetical protein